jgi:hypothetical protein
MLEYPKGTVKEEYTMSDGRVFEGRRKREDGRGLRCLMYDV